MGSSDGRFGDDDDGGDDRTHITQHPSKSELTPTNNDDDDDYERKTGGSAMAGIWGCSPRWTRSSRECISFQFSEFCRCVSDAAGWLAHWLTALLTTVYKRNVMQNRGKSITACHLANQHNSSATTSLAQMEKLEKF